MAIISRKPRSASLRFQTFIDSSDLTKKSPEKSLVIGLKKTGGRNAYGRITTSSSWWWCCKKISHD